MIPPWLDRTEHVLLRVLQGLLAVSAVRVVVIGTLMIVNMNASERSQGGAVYVGIGMLVLLGVIVGKLASVSARLKSRRGDHATGRIERSHASDGVPRTQCITEASMTQAMIGPMGMLALAGLLAFVILVGATTSACQQGVDPPAPPPPPDLTGRVLPKPPGSDDFAHRSFGHPLSLQDAEAVLRHTRVFEVGGMPPKRQVQAFNVVFEQADAVGRFRSIAEGESPAGTLYGFAALLLLDPTAAEPLRVSLSVDERRILVIESDTSDEKPVRDLVKMVEQRDMGRWFRRVRDETNDYFAKSAR